ncbi:biosynthetic-type acetolactate synthase large subunit [uncultured Ilyobacter sp.]|uniref:biosynthetic-type acetolactate synthase large subunit n=1 Tax=uncultured Ilyobacter sp. TaxID=544433 RepID=UPI0029C7A7ED|nr:biosynthetic-type acetolactate synthase large subunit [uncultured Ilyobacter sp.]
MSYKSFLKGSRIVLEVLKRMGVKDIFGYPGGAVIPIYDAFYDFQGIKHYLARHEQGATHAADGYARTTGKTGVCIATSGPGATNTVTGIMTAYMDSVPLLVITGQVPTSFLGRDSFQESDILGITSPITKHNYLVKNIEELPGILKEAYELTKKGRPGPVLVDIPKDVQMQEISMEKFEELFAVHCEYVGNKYPKKYSSKDIETAAEMIKKSNHPVFIIGGGVMNAGAAEETRKLLSQINAPSVATLMGLGAVPYNFPGHMGMIGMHGKVWANRCVNEADLIISLGMRFDDRIVGDPQRFAPHAKKIHVDIDAAEINKNVKVDLPLVGDAKDVLEDLFNVGIEADFSEWMEKCESYILDEESQEDCLNQISTIKYLGEILPESSIVVTDVGQHQMFTAQHFKFKQPLSFCTSGGAGTMGYGLPAAIGAQVGNPGKRVISIIGDGGFQMNQQELIMLRQYNLPVKIFILNNGTLGMVRQWQELFNQKRYSEVILDINPDFVKLAEANGLRGVRVSSVEELRQIEGMINDDRPLVVDVVVPRECNVYPIIPAGKSFSETIIGE